MTGDRPPRPQSTRCIQDPIWNMIITCWNEQREQRWDIRAVHNQLSASSIQEVAEGEKGNRPASRSVTHIEEVASFQRFWRHRLSRAPTRIPILPLRLTPSSGKGGPFLWKVTAMTCNGQATLIAATLLFLQKKTCHPTWAKTIQSPVLNRGLKGN